MAEEPRTDSESDPTSGDVSPEIVLACQSGRREAQRLLYERFYGRVYRLSIRLVGRQDAPDVTQNVFLQLFRKIQQYSGKAKFETWLYRLAVNEGLQHLRKRKRWSTPALRLDPANRRRDQDQADIRDAVEAALMQLPPEERSIFLLREADGLSYREISEILEIPEGTVGSRLNRARRELRKHVEDLGIS